jgi:2Fe-2S ferredoxin
VRDEWVAKTGERAEMESDMLDFAFEVKENSRLACQLKVSDTLDGLTVEVPEKQF